MCFDGFQYETESENLFFFLLKNQTKDRSDGQYGTADVLLCYGHRCRQCTQCMAIEYSHHTYSGTETNMKTKLSTGTEPAARGNHCSITLHTVHPTYTGQVGYPETVPNTHTYETG